MYIIYFYAFLRNNSTSVCESYNISEFSNKRDHPAKAVDDFGGFAITYSSDPGMKKEADRDRFCRVRRIFPTKIGCV